MSMAVGDRDENEPMMDMNTTPLIDVMLVLLIMFIITIPVQTHAVKIDLPVPTDSQSNVDPEKNKVMIDPAGTITWNGTPVDLAQLAQYLEQTKALPVEQIGRASCRERVEIWVAASALKKSSTTAATG